MFYPHPRLPLNAKSIKSNTNRAESETACVIHDIQK